MKKAEYQKRFSVGNDVTFKPTSRDKKTLIKAAENEGKSVSDYANEALTKSLKEEDDV
ncbi:hypothetical protein J8A01_22910 [Vibrio parahaemolyticus]|uniref:hypothetical protein n=1 Tax=Vibrio parahaemolyticus TaxID=670 RepID=UPI001375EC13|nr:hypothetical protein [Vibrio parahaemolyticus]MCF9126218.1 hypothetical protein [Vibrio parahaemolyticus]